MSTNGTPVTNVERIVRIDERTERMEKDIVEIKEKLDGKVDKDDCKECGARHDKATEEVKQIAVRKVSRKEHDTLEKKVDGQKSDWMFWIVAVGMIVSLVFDGILAMKVMG
jgi:hypothetical protein